jgi:hypothetical protein
MKCLINECSNNEDCMILEITKKQPEDSDSCSYFKTIKQAEKKKEERGKNESNTGKHNKIKRK